MKRFDQKNVYEVLQPLFAWTKIFGLTPFEVNREGYRASGCSFALNLFLLLLYGGISITIIVSREPDESSGIITRITDILEIYTTNLNMIVAIFMGCVHRKRMVSVIVNIQKIDQELQNLVSAINFKSSYKTTSLYLTVAIFVINIYLFMSYLYDTYMFWHDTFVKSAVISLAYICPKLITFYVFLQFSSITTLLCQRFKIINRSIERTIEVLSEPSRKFDSKESTVVKTSGRSCRFPSDLEHVRCIALIDKLRLKHYELCNISYQLNYAYSTQLLFMSMQIFVNLLSSIFYTVKHYLDDDAEKTLMLVLFTTNIAIMAMIQTLIVTVSSSRTKYEARRTGSVIHKIVPNTSEKELEFELLFFSLQLIHHNVDYSVAGLFKLDESLLISMIGVICTYLVIVIQFEFGSGDDLNRLSEANT